MPQERRWYNYIVRTDIPDYYIANNQLPYQSYDDESNYMKTEKDNFTDMLDIK